MNTKGAVVGEAELTWSFIDVCTDFFPRVGRRGNLDRVANGSCACHLPVNQKGKLIPLTVDLP